MSEHPTAAELEGLVRGDLGREEARSVVRHLLRGCDECLARVSPYAASLLDGINPAREARGEVAEAALLAELFRSSQARRADAAAAGTVDTTLLARGYDNAIDRAFAAVVRHGESAARSGARVRQLVAQLTTADLPAGLPRREVAAELRSFSGYEALLDRAWAMRRDDPRLMVELAELAVTVAGGLGADGFSAGQVEDFQARATIELANAYRVVDRLQLAQATLEAARVHLRAGSQDRLLGARLIEVEASILGDLEDFAAAGVALDAALRTYRRYGDPHLVGRCLIKKGLYAAHDGRQEEAIELLSAGLEKIDAAQDPPMALAAIHNTAFSLMSSGRYREARSLIWRHHALYQQHAGRQDHLKLRWLQGLIYAGMNELEQAAEALDEARLGMREAGRGHNAATATLELAEVRLRQGREREARALALDGADLFLALEVTAEEAAAMRFLKAKLEAPPAASGVAAVSASTAELVGQVFELLRAAVAAALHSVASHRSA